MKAGRVNDSELTCVLNDSHTDFKTLQLLSSELKLKKPLGRDLKHPKETKTRPVFHDTAPRFTKIGMSENLHLHN